MPKIVQLRGFAVQHHLIISENGIDLIDGGFFFAVGRVKRALAEHGKTLADVRNLFLTHGHLDHTLNAAKFQKTTGCRVYAPLADRDHVQGRHHYRGLSRICGWLEKVGRFALRYQTPKIDHWFQPGEIIDGLEVISLPGHTDGHSGFLRRDDKILFAGDLFANHFNRPSLPPVFLNSHSQMAQDSVRLAAQMDLNGVYLNHGARTTPEEALRALIHLADDL